jgi:hypothetical protein
MKGWINYRLFVAVHSAHGWQNDINDTMCFCHLCLMESHRRCQLAQLHDPCPNNVGDRLKNLSPGLFVSAWELVNNPLTQSQWH